MKEPAGRDEIINILFVYLSAKCSMSSSNFYGNQILSHLTRQKAGGSHHLQANQKNRQCSRYHLDSRTFHKYIQVNKNKSHYSLLGV